MRRPHPFVTAPRRNSPHITRYIHIDPETPATSPDRRLRWLADEEEIPDSMAVLKPPHVPEKAADMFFRVATIAIRTSSRFALVDP
jgi:hypothetical protein